MTRRTHTPARLRVVRRPRRGRVGPAGGHGPSARGAGGRDAVHPGLAAARLFRDGRGAGRDPARRPRRDRAVGGARPGRRARRGLVPARVAAHDLGAGADAAVGAGAGTGRRPNRPGGRRRRRRRSAQPRGARHQPPSAVREFRPRGARQGVRFGRDQGRARPARRSRRAGRRALRRADAAGGGELPDLRRTPVPLPHSRARPRHGEAGGRARQPSARAAGRGSRLGDRPGVPGDHRRPPPRPLRGRRGAGRRRHLHEHERQRGHREPRARAARRPPRRLRALPPQQPGQPLAVHQRRLPDGAQGRDRAVAARADRRPREAARGAGRQGRGVPCRGEDGTHAAPGRGPDDDGAGVHGVRRHHRRGHRPPARDGAAVPRGQHGGDRDRHRDQRRPALPPARGRAPPADHRPRRGARGEPRRGHARHRRVRHVLRRAQAHGGQALQDVQRPPAALLGPALRAGGDRAPRDAAGFLDHARQGEPGDPGSRQSGRVPGDRQRPDHHPGRGGRPAPAQRDGTDHRLQPLPVAADAHRRREHPDDPLHPRHHRQRPALPRAGGTLDRDRDGGGAGAGVRAGRARSPRKPSTPASRSARSSWPPVCSRAPSWTSCSPPRR